MSDNKCPKCNGAMDQGIISDSKASNLKYISENQKGFTRRATDVRQARACSSCGYVELYADVESLKKIIEK